MPRSGLESSRSQQLPVSTTFYRIFKKKATDSFSAIPYLCTLLNCVLWLLYGMPFVTKNGVLIMTINGIGAILEMCYLSIFMKYAAKPGKIHTAKVGGTLGVFFIVVVLVVVFATHHLHARHTIVGILCVIITIVMYAAPLSVMRVVIKTKSVEYMPLPLSVMVLLNSAAWSAYALLKKDIYIMIPNFFGVVLGIGQLILYWWYYGAPKPTLQEELEMGQKSAQQGSNELPPGALDVSNPSDVHSSNMESVSLKDSSSVETKISGSPTRGSTLPAYSTIAFSSHNLRS
ncbi:hypothetical protein AXG93_1130s1170 [Marchantia polymorpha subsp. ruderalis]|uniref:Bidirectional sugar transporter SWEET n=1 Tax=Marchantia polymorpha subsp. ruderalis TaxID=1480154 RepID=A0A176VG37_MARPO|nr:hypothetical protein AXG93_1130s1170 [Marchantia polymorpha subsp. ruderalis]